MITNKKKETIKEEKLEKIDLQFEKIIKSVMEEQGYFKIKDVKPLVTSILEQLDPIIAKHVKNHFLGIGNFLINNLTENKENGEDKNAETS